MKRIAFTTLLLSCLCLKIHAQTRAINIDPNRTKGELNTFFNECVGAGRANEGLRADWQRQLRYAKEQLGFKYIRMHGILHDDMGVYFEDNQGNPVYNWQYIDELYDFLVKIQVRPFVEFGFMPKALASADKRLVFFYWKPNISPPKDYAKWDNLIKAIVQHWTERYGTDEVKKWYFEVWNEPNLRNIFWSGDQAEYFRLYKETAEAVKSVSTLYRTGGPATSGSAWIPEFIKYCKDNNAPLDFITTHTYGSDKANILRGDSSPLDTVKADVVANNVRYVKELISHSTMPGLPLHYTEWNADGYNVGTYDHYRQTSYILQMVKRSTNAANSLSFWTFTDIFEESGPRVTPFHNGFGMINYQGICKPSFYAYQFLNRLGKHELKNEDSNSFLCKDDKGNIQVLFWDFTTKIPDSVNLKSYFKKNIAPTSKGKVAVNFRNIPGGKYRLKIYKVGYKVNDPYTAYKEMGSPSQLTRKQVEIIKQEDTGAPILEKTITINSNKGFTENLGIRENDVILITINKL